MAEPSFRLEWPEVEALFSLLLEICEDEGWSFCEIIEQMADTGSPGSRS